MPSEKAADSVAEVVTVVVDKIVRLLCEAWRNGAQVALELRFCLFVYGSGLDKG